MSPNSQWNWEPSNIWVGVGRMSKNKVVFPLAPVYAVAFDLRILRMATRGHRQSHPTARGVPTAATTKGHPQ